MEKKVMSPYYRIGIVVTLVVVVVVVIILKTRRPSARIETETVAVERQSTDPIQIDSLVQEPEPVETRIRSVEQQPSLRKDVLAMVNGEEITRAAFNEEFEALPAQYREYFKEDKAGFLEELIVKHLLLQDTQRKKITDKADYKVAVARNSGQEEQIAINLLMRDLVGDLTISESELREFFYQYKDQLPNKDFESVKEQIRPMALEEKQRVVVEDYINGLKSNAEIIRNEQWIKAQEALIADNPLNKALKSGRPVLADFGRGTCIPCKMMQPILEKIQKDFAGKAEILILDVGEYASLSRKHRVMMIPTQIFFGEKGKEVYRHQGFMSEADIVAQLKKMGVE